MSRRGKAHGFTLIELLVVMTIIGLLAGLLLGGISVAKKFMTQASCRNDITQMMIGLTQFNNDLGDYPPGGAYLNGDDSTGQLDPNNLSAGMLPADPNNPTPAELQLRSLTVQMVAEKDAGGNPTRYVGPWYQPNRANYWNTQTGAMVDRWQTPYRYLTDGRRTAIDQKTGLRQLGRVNSRMPVIWSLGPDLKQEPTGTRTGNDNIDNNKDGKVDDPSEVGDDICSWNSN